MSKLYTLVINDNEHTFNTKEIKGLRSTEVNNGSLRLYFKTVRGQLRSYYFKRNKVYSYSYKTHKSKQIGKLGYIIGE